MLFNFSTKDATAARIPTVADKLRRLPECFLVCIGRLLFLGVAPRHRGLYVDHITFGVASYADIKRCIVTWCSEGRKSLTCATAFLIGEHIVNDVAALQACVLDFLTTPILISRTTTALYRSIRSRV